MPKEGVHADHAAVLAEGKLDDLRPDAPVEEGATVDVKLVELDRHDSQAAVGKLDGVDVVVGSAAKLIGKKAKVRVERVLDGAAYAALVAGAAAAAAPITFESEAEKPTRTPRPKKAADAAETAAEPATTVDEPVDEAEPAEAGESEGEGVEEAAAAVADDGTEDGAAAKKKTRRGSRGGRGRKKKPAPAEGDGAVDEAVADEAEQPEPVEPTPRAPRIHVPAADLGGTEVAAPRRRAEAEALAGETAQPAAEGDGEEQTVDAATATAVEIDETGEPKPKKKTRRGSRGGRNRKKKPATTPSENGAEGAEAAAEPEAAAAETCNGADAVRQDWRPRTNRVAAQARVRADVAQWLGRRFATARA